MYRCDYCLAQRFLTKEKLFQHVEICCKSYINCNEILPEEGKNILQFKNIGNIFNHPFHVVADFESTLLPVEEEEKEEQDDDMEMIKTKKYQKHVPNSFGLKYNCIHNVYSKPIAVFNSSDPETVCKRFIEKLEKLAKYSHTLTQNFKTKVKYTVIQKQNHNSQMHCKQCKCTLTKDDEIQPSSKVAHHDHITGQFISTLCYDCNIQFEYKKFFPVNIHNLKGYDCHLFVSSLFKYGYKQGTSDNIS